MHHRRIRGGMAGLVAASGVVALASTAVAAAVVVRSAGQMRDYDTVAAGPFDHATARVQLVGHGAGTTAVLHVRGIDPTVAGRTFGAHLHDGPCATDQPALASGHYNVDAHAGHLPASPSPATEVWLDFTVDAAGGGDSSAVVRFPVQPGTRSVVVHAAPTNPVTGAAGARLACLPVEW